MGTRLAVVVGINKYARLSKLFGCEEDAKAVEEVLSRHGGGDPNFECRLFTQIKRHDLKDRVAALFSAANVEIALFYFAGHGHVETTGGYLLASDAEQSDDGVPLGEILTLANRSPAENKVIVLDSCHSGLFGNPPNHENVAQLSEGLTVLTASTKEQYATIEDGRGVFTTLFVDALNGGAANLAGDISPGSVYAHIDQSLGGWEQRPVFKTNVKSFVSLRTVPPPIEKPQLRLITKFFPSPDHEFPLDPAYEPEMKGRDRGMPPPDPEKTAIFAVLQKYNRLNLLVPVGAPHMWHAAMQSKSCKLTALGRHYWRLVDKGRI